MIHIARHILIAFGICVGIPYVLALIGIAKLADKRAQRKHACR
jgi:hypothetical protein